MIINLNRNSEHLKKETRCVGRYLNNTFILSEKYKKFFQKKEKFIFSEYKNYYNVWCSCNNKLTFYTFNKDEKPLCKCGKEIFIINNNLPDFDKENKEDFFDKNLAYNYISIDDDEHLKEKNNFLKKQELKFNYLREKTCIPSFNLNFYFNKDSFGYVFSVIGTQGIQLSNKVNRLGFEIKSYKNFWNKKNDFIKHYLYDFYNNNFYFFENNFFNLKDIFKIELKKYIEKNYEEIIKFYNISKKEYLNLEKDFFIESFFQLLKTNIRKTKFSKNVNYLRNKKIKPIEKYTYSFNFEKIENNDFKYHMFFENNLLKKQNYHNKNHYYETILTKYQRNRKINNYIFLNIKFLTDFDFFIIKNIKNNDICLSILEDIEFKSFFYHFLIQKGNIKGYKIGYFNFFKNIIKNFGEINFFSFLKKIKKDYIFNGYNIMDEFRDAIIMFNSFKPNKMEIDKLNLNNIHNFLSIEILKKKNKLKQYSTPNETISIENYKNKKYYFKVIKNSEELKYYSNYFKNCIFSYDLRLTKTNLMIVLFKEHTPLVVFFTSKHNEKYCINEAKYKYNIPLSKSDESYEVIKDFCNTLDWEMNFSLTKIQKGRTNKRNKRIKFLKENYMKILQNFSLNI